MADYTKLPRREPFEPAFRKQIKWSVKDNDFEDSDVNPKALSIFIPIESVFDLHNHLSALMDDPEKRRRAKIWDYEKKEEIEVEGIYLNGKGKNGQYGDFGAINPKKIAQTEELPF